MRRRQFLRQSASTLFAGGLAPAILGSEDKSGTKPVVIGFGEFQFSCNHRWCEVPRHIKWFNTHGVAIDRSGFVYVVHQGNAAAPCDTVVIFDPTGRYVRSFGKEFAGGGHGIDIRREGKEEFIYLSDIHQRQIVKCDLQGEWVWRIRYPHQSGHYDSVDQFCPTNVAFAENGDFYVADGYGSHLIHRYNNKAVWQQTWGGEGTRPGQFATPHGLCVDTRRPSQPLLRVADRANARLQSFSLSGELQDVMGKDDSSEGENKDSFNTKRLPGLSFPASIDIWENLLLIADMHGAVLMLDERDQLLANLGGSSEWTRHILQQKEMRTNPALWPAGKFIHPHDACFDQDGNLYVTEWLVPGRVTKLSWL